MPEGNEIHRWAARHTSAFAGKRLRVDAPAGSSFANALLLDGRKLVRVTAMGKHLGYDFGADRLLHVHLGLRGDFKEGTGELPPEKGALRLRIWNEKAAKLPAQPGRSKHRLLDDGITQIEPEKIAWLELRGPSDCSVWTQARWNELCKRLGPDPLHGENANRFVAQVAKRKTAIGVLLMDQTVCAGIGNLFRAEVLFRARLSPFAEGRSVPETILKTMWKDAAFLMKAAMVDRRIVTTMVEHRPVKKEGLALMEEVHYVYRRQGKPCRVCESMILTRMVAGRNLFWCPHCQLESGQLAQECITI